MAEADLVGNARRVYKSFVLTLRKLLVEEKQQFDLVVGPGDSGAVMVKFTQYVYEVLQIPPPKFLWLPVLRPSQEYFDQASLKAEEQIEVFSKTVRKQISTEVIGRILFVDDEIGQGEAMQVAISAVAKARGQHQLADHVTVLAEDHGFAADKIELPNTVVEFRPFSAYVGGIYNAIFWLIPSRFEEPIKQALRGKKVDSDKYPMSILLNVPLKELANGYPIFSYRFHELVAARVPNLPALQKEFQDYIRRVTNEIIFNRKPSWD